MQIPNNLFLLLTWDTITTSCVWLWLWNDSVKFHPYTTTHWHCVDKDNYAAAEVDKLGELIHFQSASFKKSVQFSVNDQQVTAMFSTMNSLTSALFWQFLTYLVKQNMLSLQNMHVIKH